jgi:hypothetical protein
MMKYILYGFVTAILVAAIASFITNLQGVTLPPIYYIGIIIFFTPFAAWLRYIEIKRKNKEKDDDE